MLQQAQWDKLLRLRGFLAFYVLLHHVRNLLWPRMSEVPGDDTTLRLGAAVVNILGEWGLFSVLAFFVVSGFSIGIAYRRKYEIPKFWKARVRRLYPAFLFSLLVAAICYFLQHGNFAGQRINLISTLLLQNGITFGGEFAGNAPYWSLACEGFYYLLFPFLFFGNYGAQRIVWIGITCLVVFFLLEHFRLVHALLYFPVWLVGLFASLKVNQPVSPGATLSAVGIVGAAMVAWILLDVKGGLIPPFSHGIALVSGCAIALLILKTTQVSKNLPLLKIRNFFGEISYSLYLVHYPVLLLTAYYFPGVSMMKSLVTSVIAIIASLGISYLAYRFFEKPFIKHRA